MVNIEAIHLEFTYLDLDAYQNLNLVLHVACGDYFCGLEICGIFESNKKKVSIAYALIVLKLSRFFFTNDEL